MEKVLITFSQVEKFIKFYLNDKNLELNPQTRLQHDLRIYGYDAEDFFDAFAKEFHLTLPNIPLEEFFLGEGGISKPWWWGKVDLEDKSDVKPFMVQDLLELANSNKLPKL